MNIQITPVQTHIDNIGAAYMAEQIVTNKRTKHISQAYHYARAEVQIFKNYSLKYDNTLLNCSDIFTKPLDRGLTTQEFYVQSGNQSWQKQLMGSRMRNTGGQRRYKHALQTQ